MMRPYKRAWKSMQEHVTKSQAKHLAGKMAHLCSDDQQSQQQMYDLLLLLCTVYISVCTQITQQIHQGEHSSSLPSCSLMLGAVRGKACQGLTGLVHNWSVWVGQQRHKGDNSCGAGLLCSWVIICQAGQGFAHLPCNATTTTTHCCPCTYCHRSSHETPTPVQGFTHQKCIRKPFAWVSPMWQLVHKHDMRPARMQSAE